MTQQKNSPDIWLSSLPQKTGERHKYDYGHAVIHGAPSLTGATRLAASSCARIGAGLTTVLCTLDTADTYRASLPAHIMVRDNLKWWDDRITAQLYGSGGLSGAINVRDIPTVLDADALFKLPEGLHNQCILTPHEGEFEKAFPDVKGAKGERALKVAEQTGTIVMLKGPETIIAHPADGRIIINEHASPYLASAGTGDVLAGLITGLLAQGMEPFMAANAAAWIHGEAGRKIGPGLVASDVHEKIPEILCDLFLNFQS